jgi:hypothetical protein
MREILRLSLPMTVWLVGFSAIYALQGLACSRHWPPDFEARPVLIAAFAVAVMVQVAILIYVVARPSPSRHLQSVTTALAITGIVAVLWTFMPVVAASVCA